MKLFIYSPTAAEIEAIIVALPLIDAASFLCETEIQAQINHNCAISAGNKLLNEEQLTPNEMRVVALSCYAAVEYVAGHLELDVDLELRSKIQQRYFIYSRLNSNFKQFLDEYPHKQ